MKKEIGKRVISILLAVLMVISLLPQLTATVEAADADDMTSNELAQAWGFKTAQPEASKEREELGTNPWNAHAESVSTFGEVPLEIAVVGSRISSDNDYHSQNDDDLDDIYYYDQLRRSNDKTYLNTGSSGFYNSVDGITDDAEVDVRPSATVTADMNGDGFDEIVRYYIDISGGENDGDIQAFNDGKSGYKAEFFVEVIDSQTGNRLNSKSSGQVLSVRKSDSGSENFFIPNSVYYWSSYMQMTAGDYNNDGKKEVAVLVPDKDGSGGKLCILNLNGTSLVQVYSKNCTNYSTYDKDQPQNTKFSAYCLTSGDCDNDGTDELVYTSTYDVITEDSDSYIHVLDYDDSAYSLAANYEIRVSQNHDNMGNAGVTVGDIDNDGLKEIVVGGFMVNDDSKNATYSYTAKDGSGTKDIKYYHEMAMAYMEYDNNTGEYSGFTGFSVFRDDEQTAGTCVGGNDTSYQTYSERALNSSRRYKNSSNWTLPIQAVSLTGYVNNRTNDQVFFGNYMYYFNGAKKLFEVYDSDGEVDVDEDPVVYRDIQAPTTSIMTMIPGSFLSDDPNYVATEGRQQILVGYVRKKNNGDRSFEMAILYENAGDTMVPQRSVKYIAKAKDNDFNDMKFYPTVCAPNMDNDTKYVQYVGHEFTYTEPEVLNVIASVPYFQDIMDAFPVGVWGDPGSTYIKKASGSSQTNTAFTEVKLGWYFNFHQDISVLGIRLFSIEAETNASVNTNFEYSKTIEKESSIQYETSEGQDSVVMVSSPLDVYQYRYYEGTDQYAKAYPGAVKDKPETWGYMEVSLPSKPATLVFSVERYNQLALKYGLEQVGNTFWTHIKGEPGTYPTSKSQFLNASNVISCDDPLAATTGGSSQTGELSITETQENAYSVSFTLGAKFGVGVGGLVTGTTVENTTGYGGSSASYKNTTIGATLNGFPDQEIYDADLDTTGYRLSTRLHSYTTKFNDKNIVVLDFTVEDYGGLPRRVENFRSTGSREAAIDLAWDVPANISAKLRPAKYTLERYDPYYKVWEMVNDGLAAEAGTNTYTDTDVYADESYQYRLTSVDSTGVIKNAVVITASTRNVGKEPPEITQQPLNATVGIGENVEYSIIAKIPDGSAPTRIYYQWYMRADSGAAWSAINGAIDKNLKLTAATMDMNGYQYYCAATRLAEDGTHCTSNSDYATLSVLDHDPLKYRVSFYSDSNGKVTAQQTYGNTSVPVTSETYLTEGSTVKFTAVPASGYTVSKWTINGKTVSGNTEKSLIVDNLSGRIDVSVSFGLSLYTFRYMEAIDSGDTSHGTITAECNGNTLPMRETTTLPGNSKITIHATPDPGYMVYYISDNISHSSHYINDLTIDSLSYDTSVSVKFIKAEYRDVRVHSSIVNTDVAYADDSGYSVYANGTELAPGANIPFNSKVEIVAKIPKSAIVESWTIYQADSNGNPQGTPITLGSQTSYTFDQLYDNYSVTINYRVVTSKTLTYSIKGGSGTLTAQVVGNTAASGKVNSGGKVQMYQDVALTVSPSAGEQLSGWLVNGVLESSAATTKVVNMNKNTVIQAVIETKPTAKAPAYTLSTNADKTINLDGNSVADDLDGDTLTFTAISDDVSVDTNVATVKLGSGADSGKLLIKSVAEGSTSVKAEVTDDSGNSIMVTIPITVTNNNQTVPALTGVMNSSLGVNDGKITGLDRNVTYFYKSDGETDYHTVSGKTAITGLTPGEYTVYCPAKTGYNESAKVHVTVASNDFAGGTGTVSDPYQITTPSMLDNVRNHMGDYNQNFILMNDIDMTEYLSPSGEGYNNGNGFIPIGRMVGQTGASSFIGTFDGNGKKITGLLIKQSQGLFSHDDVRNQHIGLFGRLGGVVKNLGIDVDITTYGDYVGAITGENSGTISRCYSTGQITGIKNDYVGGLAGASCGLIENCYSTAAISGYNGFAGLVGYLQVSGSGYYQQKGTITTSYSISKFTFAPRETGLTAGCLIAKMDADAIINYSWAYDIDSTSYNPEKYDNFNNTNELYTLDTLKSKSFYESNKWDFDNIWSIDDGNDFPKLRTPIYVTDIILDEIESSFSVGDEHTLTAVVEPDDAATKKLYWISSDTEVAVVDQNGLIKAVSAGTADITAGACDGSGVTATCIVTVTGGTEEPDTPSSEKAIIGFTLGSEDGSVDADGTINESDHTIAFTLPFGTDVTSLTPTITVSDKASISPESGIAQNFTSPVTYTVTAEDESTQIYTVTVTVGSEEPEDSYGISLSQTAAYSFPGQTEGYGAVTPLSITVTSTGNQATGDLDAALRGTNASSFTLSKTALSSIAAGGSETFTVVPNTGLGAGTYTATVTVSGSNVTSQSFEISFTVSTGGDPVDPGTPADPGTPVEPGNSGGGGSGGGGGGGATPPSTGTNITVTTGNNTTTATQTVTATTASNGIAAASVTSAQISELVTAAKEKGASNAQTAVALQVETGSSAMGVSVTLPKAAVTTLTSGEANLTVSSAVATVTLDSATLAEISKQTTGDVTIKATMADTSTLSEEAKTAIGTRPVYDLKITSGNTTVSSFGSGTATVSVPYTPDSGEDVNAIVVYYINASGELVTVPNGVYDAKTKTITFTTTHFSTYAVGYNEVSFSDVAGSAWYADYVTCLAARGIASGNKGAFNPNDSITRAEFVTILARMSGDDMSGYTTASFTDVAANSWYSAAVQWANKAGIASGYDGKFNPNATITREQMAVMLYRYAEFKGTVSNAEGMSVREFTDYDNISSWAQAPIQWAKNNNILSGNNDGSFHPQSSATRAQSAKMLAVLLQSM